MKILMLSPVQTPDVKVIKITKFKKIADKNNKVNLK